MRRFQLPLEQYDSDKISGRYLERYDPVLEPWLEKEIVLLELGVHRGGSLLLWRDYFPRGTIVGIDPNPPPNFKPTNRIHFFQGSQGDLQFLSQVAKEVAPDGFDIVIDDASHLGELSKVAFWHLFDNHLKPKGLYVIEDWGTGYWDDWPDGKSLDLEGYSPWRSRGQLVSEKGSGESNLKDSWPCHSYGMVGFIKQLIDEQGARDVTREGVGGKPTRVSKFESVLIVPSIVFVRKAENIREPEAPVKGPSQLTE